MKENQKKAFDFASETTKQLITISTAIITITVTFSKEIIGGADTSTKILLMVAWGLFLFSIIFGVFTLMALTGTLQPLSEWNKQNKQTNKKEKNHKDKQKSVEPAEVQKPEINNDECCEININKGNIRLFSILQAISFLFAIFITVIYGINSLSNKQNENHKNCIEIIRHSTLNNDTIKKYTDTLYIPLHKYE